MDARCLLLFSLMLAAGWARALGETPAAPDFSDAFVKLAALGMPALDSGAKWAALPDSRSNNYQIQELAKAVKGNGWLLPPVEGKLRVLPMGGIEIVTPAGIRRPKTIGDPAKDVNALVSSIQKATEKDSSERYSYGSSASEMGILLLFATQLHQTGHPDLANRLALASFKMFPSREAAVDAAIDQIAGHLYEKASGDFFKSGDWNAYHRALTDLTEHFPRGWAARDAIRIFLPQLEKQAAGAKAPAPSLADVSLDPQALAIILEFTEKSPADPDQPEPVDAEMSDEIRYRIQMMRGMGGYYEGEPAFSSLWLTSETPEPAEEKNSQLSRLTLLKMAALPALAALLEDPFLTHIRNPRSNSSYGLPDESGDERTLRTYLSLQRPATRGEIAKGLLVATLPDPDDELDEAEPETLRSLALTFWKQHQNASRAELAAVFLRDGSRSQSAEAATILATSAAPAAHQVFESHILASDEALTSLQQVQAYLRTRRAAAKPFFDSYAALVRSQNPESADGDSGHNESSWRIREAGGMDKILKQLETLVGSQSPRALATRIAKGKPAEAEAAIQSLSALLTDAPPAEHLTTLLEGAAAASDASVRARFLGATLRVRQPQVENGDENSPPPDREVSESEIKIWRELITDTREIPGELDQFQRAGNSTVADLTAFAFEYSVSPVGYYKAASAAPILSKPLNAILRAQAEARLSGQPLPPLPDATRIPPERLAEIIAEAAKKEPAGIHPYLKSLTPDERAAWIAWVQESGEIAIPPSVKALRFLVIGPLEENFTGFPITSEAGGIDTGFQLTPASLTAAIDLLAADVSKHSRTAIFLQGAAFAPGLEVLAVSAPIPAKSDAPDETSARLQGRPSIQGIFGNALRFLADEASAEGVVLLAYTAGNHYERAAWRIENGRADPVEPESPATLNAAIVAATESPDFQEVRIGIQILSKADADQIKALDSND